MEKRANDRRAKECLDHNPDMIATDGFWGRFECKECGWHVTCDRALADKEGLVWDMGADRAATAKMSVEKQIRKIAREHRRKAPETTHVYVTKWDEDPEEVKFLEVTTEVTTTRSIIPFRFAPDTDAGIAFCQTIAVASPKEHEMLKNGELDLPDGWGEFKDLIQI